MKFELFEDSCEAVVKNLIPKDVDAIITDPPYGMRFVQKSGRMKSLGYKEILNDDKQLDLSFLFGLTQNMVIFGGNFFDLPISRGWIVWDKQNGKKVDFGDCELIWTSHDRPPRIITHIWDGFRRDSDKGLKRVHPSQKPTGLMEKIILEFTKEGDTVLDPFMGSGTTGVACVNTNRNFIGIEKEPEYFQIAKKRIQEAYDNLPNDPHQQRA